MGAVKINTLPVLEKENFMNIPFDFTKQNNNFLKFHQGFDIFKIRQIRKPHIYPLVSTGMTDEK